MASTNFTSFPLSAIQDNHNHQAERRINRLDEYEIQITCDLILAEFAAGMSVKKLSRDFGVPVSVIYEVLRVYIASTHKLARINVACA